MLLGDDVMLRTHVAVFAIFAATACGSSGDAPAVDAFAAPDGAFDAAPATVQVSIPSWEREFGNKAAWDVQIDATGDGFIGDVSVDTGVGTATIDGKAMHVFVYESGTTVDGDGNHTMLAVGADSLYRMTVTCLGGTAATWVWAGGSGDDFVMQPLALSGTCSGGTLDEQTVTVPATDFVWTDIDHGFVITGDALNLDRGPGTIRLQGLAYQLLPLAELDCSACPTPYRALDVLAWRDEISQTAVVGTLYFNDESPSDIDARWSNTLPDFTSVAAEDLEFTATWQHQ